MEKSVFKVFFSKEKEKKWLDSMGKEGYLLSQINDSKYIFTRSEDQKYFYSIEYLDFSPLSEDASEYFESRKADGIRPLVSSGNWVYFASSRGEIEMNESIYKKNSKVYFWRSLYLLFFALCGAVLCGYQVFSIGFLSRIGYEGNGQIREMLSTSDSGGMLDGLLNVLKEIANFFFKLINAYFRLWTSVFGESDAVAVISVIAPIVLILLIICAFNLDNYVFFRKAGKIASQNTISQTESEVADAKQTI